MTNASPDSPRPRRRRRLILRLIGVAILALAGLAGALVYRTVTLPGARLVAEPPAPSRFDKDALAARLSRAIQFRTVSTPAGDGPEEASQLEAFRAFLASAFPLTHARLERELVNGCSLVFRWPGTKPDLKPVLLMSHLDVVPGEVPFSGTKTWTHPPFAGTIADGFIWGRGAWDDKSGVLGLLEATEALIAEGHRPERTLYIHFGCDEEVNGRRGAVQAAALFATRGLRFAWVLDEGLTVTHGIVPGVRPPAALVGIAEKGYLTIELSVAGAGGHSSMPPAETPIGLVGGAVARLEARQMSPRMTKAAAQMFDALAPELPFLQRLVMANRWLFDPLLMRTFSRSAATAALVRTTTSPTVFQAGIKENVLPPAASALVNFRIRPGETIADVMRHVEATIGDPRITLRALPNPSEPSAESAITADGYATIARTIRQIFPDAVVAPGLMLAATDSRYFLALADDLYRFAPVRVGNTDLQRFHGVDERISVDGYADAVRFYRQLILNTR